MSEFVETGTEDIGSKQQTPQVERLQAAEAKLLLNTYARNPILFTHGEGVELFDENNTPYLDLLSGIGVCALGYNHPAITAAITAQAQALLHTSQSLLSSPHRRASPPPHRDHRPRPCLLLQLRHRSLGGRA